MRIENEVKLDFSDVLIRPKRSTLSSRKEVSLERVFTFRNGATWRGVPIMAANMDGVGTFEMSAALSSHGMITCLVKSYNLDDFEHNVTQFFTGHTAISTGTSDKDFIRLQLIVNQYPDMIQFICIDIANGYSEHFGNFVAKVRKLYPTKTIIAGNVVTADMTQELILRGADIVKVGIGPGCFTPDTLVLTNKGWKAISTIEEGELVLTHNNTWEPVTHLWKFDHHKQLAAVSLEDGSEYKMTPDHKVFAVHQSKADQCKCDEDIQRLGEWIHAKDLNSDWLVATT